MCCAYFYQTFVNGPIMAHSERSEKLMKTSPAIAWLVGVGVMALHELVQKIQYEGAYWEINIIWDKAKCCIYLKTCPPSAVFPCKQEQVHGAL